VNKPYISKLKNNLPIIFIPNRNISYIGISFKITAGSNYEDTTNTGSAHFTEHWILSKHAETLEMYGGKVWGITSRDSCLIYIKVLKEYFKEAIEYLTTILLDKDITEKTLEKQKEIVVQEINRSLDGPDKIILRRSYKTLYPNTRLEILNTGELEDVKRLSMDTVKEFRTKHYNAENSVLGITGDLETKTMESILNRYMGKLPKGRAVKNRIIELAEEYKNKTVTQVIQGKYKQNHYKLDFYGFRLDEKDRYPLEYLANILDRYLNRILREEKGLAYKISVQNFSSSSYGMFSIYTSSDNKDILTYINDALYDLEQVIENTNIEILKRNITSNLIFELEKPAQLMDFYITNYLPNNNISIEDEIDKYKEITKDDIFRTYRYISNQKQKVTILK